MTAKDLIQNKKNKKESKPLIIRAGDKRVLLNGTPPLVDCRVLSEDFYQGLIEKPNVKDLIEKYENWHNEVDNWITHLFKVTGTDNLDYYRNKPIFETLLRKAEFRCCCKRIIKALNQLEG